MKLGLKSNKNDPIVEKVSREGLFGKKLADVDLNKPFKDPGAEQKAARLIGNLEQRLRELSLPLIDLVINSGRPDTSLQKVNSEDIKELLKNGADINVRDDASGMTPLLYAVRSKKSNMIHLLVEMGADLEARDPDGYKPLHYASLKGDGDTCLYLLTKGANPIATTNDGRTALMLAASTGDRKAVTVLLQKGAGPNLQDNAGETALMCAINRQKLLAVNILLDDGADFTICNNKGEDALTIAKESARAYRKAVFGKNPYNNIILELRKHGAVEKVPLTFWQVLRLPPSHIYYYMKYRK